MVKRLSDWCCESRPVPPALTLQSIASPLPVGWDEMGRAVIGEPQGSVRNRAVRILQSSVAVVQGVSVPGRTLTVPSVLGKILAGVHSVKIPQYDEQGVWMGFFFSMSV